MDGYPQGVSYDFFLSFLYGQIKFATQIESRICLRHKLKRHGCSMFAPHEKPCLRNKEPFKGTPLKYPRGAQGMVHCKHTENALGSIPRAKIKQTQLPHQINFPRTQTNSSAPSFPHKRLPLPNISHSSAERIFIYLPRFRCVTLNVEIPPHPRDL